jgi:hypothetical protein
MTTYIFKQSTPDTDKGTKLFLQDGMYFYKTNTETEKWLSIEEVEGDTEKFEKIN